MAQPQIILAFDVINNSLVANFQGSRSGVPEFGQSKGTVRIYLLQPNANAIVGSVSNTFAAYENYSTSGFDGVRLGIWSDSTGALDDSSQYVLALTPHTDFTTGTDDDGYAYFQGEFNTYTQQIADWLTEAAVKTNGAYLACYLVEGVNLTKVFDQRQGQTNCVINSSTDDGSGELPVDMTTEIPTTRLPWHIQDPTSGELYALTRTSAGVLEFVWINPP